MKRWGAVAAAMVLLALFVAADKTGGCEQFNRMGISPDGNSIAFSLNGKGGFSVDETSALYKLDLTDCHLTRVSADKPLATWADINSKGDVLFTWRSKETGDSTEVAVARVNGEVEELTRNVVSDSVPQWLDSTRVLLATTPPLKPNGDQDDEEYDVFLSVADLRLVVPAEAAKGPKRTDVVHEFYGASKKRVYWSSLPVWSGNQLAYAAGDVVTGDDPDKVKEMTCRFYLVDLESKERREVASLTFEAKPDTNDMPVGYVDLAFSPDGKKLAACFLSKDFEKDEEVSHLYVIDLETAKAELLKEDVNMYYPRFAPKAEGEPYRLLYLSGTGEGGKGRSINVLNLETKQARKVISLPGVIMTAYTDWRWLSELTSAEEKTPKNRLRVYHLSDVGLIIAELNDDGSNLSIRYLDTSRLRLGQVEADLRWAQSVAEGAAGHVEAAEKAQAEAKKSVSGSVEFLRVETVPQPAVTQGKGEPSAPAGDPPGLSGRDAEVAGSSGVGPPRQAPAGEEGRRPPRPDETGRATVGGGTAPLVSPAYEQLLQEREPLLLKVRLLRALRGDFGYASDPKKGVQLERDIKAAFVPLVALYDRYLREHPDDARAHYDLGLLYYDEGEDEDAATVHWLRTVELAPDFDQAYNSLAVHYADTADHEKALRSIAKALELNPNVAMYHFNAATFYFSFRKEAMQVFGWDLPRTWREVLSHYETALKMEPTNYVFARDYAQTFNNSGFFQVPPDLKKARAAWELALPLAPSRWERVMVLTYLARVASCAGDDDGAKKYLKQARELSPDNFIVRSLEERLARGEHLRLLLVPTPSPPTP